MMGYTAALVTISGTLPLALHCGKCASLGATHLKAARQLREGGGQLGGLQVDEAELRALVQEVLLQSHQLGPADAAGGLADARVLETHDVHPCILRTFDWG